MSEVKIYDATPDRLTEQLDDITEAVEEFARIFTPLEVVENLYLLVDAKTNARYCECHVQASKLIALSTPDAPLDPEEQAEYRANREIVEDHVAYRAMKSDALEGRTFSNIVAEFTDAGDPARPLKIIGGQHRFEAINQALENGVDELHGIKVYFGLDIEQRLDVQLISNTNIAASTDLLDRAYETTYGPQLRNWCHEVGLLYEGQDFGDKKASSKPITVREVRTFILNK